MVDSDTSTTTTPPSPMFSRTTTTTAATTSIRVHATGLTPTATINNTTDITHMTVLIDVMNDVLPVPVVDVFCGSRSERRRNVTVIPPIITTTVVIPGGG